MSATGKGDWVEVIGAPVGTVCRRTGIVAGRVYQVDGLVWGRPCSRCEDEHPGIHLVGFARDKNGFAGCHFVPVYRPRATIIEQLKQPAPDIVRETENA